MKTRLHALFSSLSASGKACIYNRLDVMGILRGVFCFVLPHTNKHVLSEYKTMKSEELSFRILGFYTILYWGISKSAYNI